MSDREVKIRILTELQKLDIKSWPTVTEISERIGLDFEVVNKACNEMNQDGRIKLRKDYGSGGVGKLQLKPSGRAFLEEIEESVHSGRVEITEQVNVNISQSNVAVGGSSIAESNTETTKSNSFPWVKTIMAGIIVAIIVGLVVHINSQ